MDVHDKRRAEDNDVTRERNMEIEFVIGGRSRFYGSKGALNLVRGRVRCCGI